MFAPLPGVSRSGLTISAALALGFSRTWAVNFSLMMAVPAILGATVFELRKLDASTLTGERVAQIVASSAVAGVIGYLGDRLAGPACPIGAAMVFFCIPGPAWDHADRGGFNPEGPTRCPALASSGPALTDRRSATGRSSGRRPRRQVYGSSPRRWRAQQVSRALSHRWKSIEPPRVWCWDDAWKATARAHADPPARLSHAGRIAVLAEAIERARRSGSLHTIGRAIDWPGYRRHLLDRFAAWTVEERPVTRASPTDSPVDHEEWAVFGHYRATLHEIGAEDAEGFAVWASRTWIKRPPIELSKPGHVVVIDPTSPTRADWRLLDSLQSRARSITVVLPFDAEPSLAELYSGVDSTRNRFLEWGFIEEADRSEGFSYRPPGLDYIERELFRTDVFHRSRLGRTGGLKILGGPRGEGLGLLVAREASARIEGGTPPEEILVLVPRLDEDAAQIREVLASWGLPVSASLAGRLSTVPAISALRLAIRLPVERWEVSTLVRLLRNGQVRWSGGDLSTTFGPSEAASAIRATRVFRDRATLRTALASTLDRKPKDPARPWRPSTRSIGSRAGSTRSRSPVPGSCRSTGSGSWPTRSGWIGLPWNRSGTRSRIGDGSCPGSGRPSPKRP